MAFIPSSSALTLTAKFTPFGRQQLLSNATSTITKFSLGDSDANYRAALDLASGEVPSSAGSLGTALPNSVTTDVSVKYKVYVDANGNLYKNVSDSSNVINTVDKQIGTVTAVTSGLTAFVIDKANYSTDSKTNLFSSFGLPITNDQQAIYNSITYNNGGLSDTALRFLNQSKVLIVSVDASQYGEALDGRVCNISITTTGGTYVFYSTYEASLTSLDTQDAKTAETSLASTNIGSNVAFLFSDIIQRPNNNVLRSWSTGFDMVKPFSVNGKQLYNLTSNPSLGINSDLAGGIVYLDKGIFVITFPDIVNTYNTGDDITIVFNSIYKEVSQNVTCIVDRGEFSISTNPTYGSGDIIRVSEVGLHDDDGNLLAIAKTDRHIAIGASQFMAIGVKIVT